MSNEDLFIILRSIFWFIDCPMPSDEDIKNIIEANRKKYRDLEVKKEK